MQFKNVIFFLDMTTSQIETENTQMINDLYRLLKKYTGLRNLIRDLKVKFSKFEKKNFSKFWNKILK